MGLHRNVITQHLNNNPQGSAAAVSAWFDLLQGLLREVSCYQKAGTGYTC